MIANTILRDAATWRHALHAKPEFGFDVHVTARFVAERLRAFGCDVHEGIGGTGVVGVLDRGGNGRRLGLRADMDALPINEANTFAHASCNAGFMHACGHDGHTAMLLGAARALAEDKGFTGHVTFIFQPAEEHGEGAQAMIDDGLFERFPVDEVYAVHNMPGIPAGVLATRAGPIMAAEENFEIELRGRGGHAARPHLNNETLIAACHLVTQLQTVVSRRVDPLANAVVSVTSLDTDGERNALPGRAVLRGDTRSFTDEVQNIIEGEMRRLSEGVGYAFNQEVSFSYSRSFAPTVNHEAPVRALCEAAATVPGLTVIDNCDALMASEDFGVMLRHRPGAYAFLGNGLPGERGGMPLHNPLYDFNDDLLPVGIGVFVALAKARTSA